MQRLWNALVHEKMICIIQLRLLELLFGLFDVREHFR